MRLAATAGVHSLCTFEFLLDASEDADDASFAFIEANPRLQVEHTITEEVFGVDLVQAQIRVAAGESLEEIGLAGARAPRGHAIQARVNLEVMTASGEAAPSGGRIAAFDIPSGPGVRVDAFGYSGYRTAAAFNSLIAKLIVHSPSGGSPPRRRRRRGRSASSASPASKPMSPSSQALLTHPDFVAGRIDTRFIERRLPELLKSAAKDHRRLYFEAPEDDAPGSAAIAHRGAGRRTSRSTRRFPATLVSVDVAEGDVVRPGQQIAVIEAMKMEHLVSAPCGGIVRGTPRAQGRHALQGRSDPLPRAGRRRRRDAGAAKAEAVDSDAVRQDLADMLARQAFGLDENRPEAVARRRKTNHRTARENIAALVDAGASSNTVPSRSQRRRRAGRRTISSATRRATGSWRASPR